MLKAFRIVPVQGATLFRQGFSSHLYHPFVLKIHCLDLRLISGTPLCDLGQAASVFSPVKIGRLLLKISSTRST